MSVNSAPPWHLRGPDGPCVGHGAGFASLQSAIRAVNGGACGRARVGGRGRSKPQAAPPPETEAAGSYE